MTTRENIARMFKLLRPYRGKQVQTLFFMIAAIVLSLVLPLILKFLIDDVIGKKRPDLLVPLVAFTFAVFLATSLFNFLTSYLFNVMGQSIIRDVRRALFAHLAGLPFKFLTEQGTGRIMARVLNDVGTIGGVVSSILLDLFIQSCTLAISTGDSRSWLLSPCRSTSW
jgi:ABC-type bacteriocin/lantibiotic exporter with double-glycine peptidase domain